MDQQESHNVPTISCKKFHEMREKKNKDYIVIDVRNQEQWDQKHLPEAEHIPLEELEQTVEAKIPNKKDTDIIVCCRSGRSSAAGVQKLIDMGYEYVYNLEGGYENEYCDKFGETD